MRPEYTGGTLYQSVTLSNAVTTVGTVGGGGGPGGGGPGGCPGG